MVRMLPELRDRNTDACCKVLANDRPLIRQHTLQKAVATSTIKNRRKQNHAKFWILVVRSGRPAIGLIARLLVAQ